MFILSPFIHDTQQSQMLSGSTGYRAKVALRNEQSGAVAAGIRLHAVTVSWWSWIT